MAWPGHSMALNPRTDTRVGPMSQRHPLQTSLQLYGDQRPADLTPQEAPLHLSFDGTGLGPHWVEGHPHCPYMPTLQLPDTHRLRVLAS